MFPVVLFGKVSSYTQDPSSLKDVKKWQWPRSKLVAVATKPTSDISLVGCFGDPDVIHCTCNPRASSIVQYPKNILTFKFKYQNNQSLLCSLMPSVLKGELMELYLFLSVIVPRLELQCQRTFGLVFLHVW